MSNENNSFQPPIIPPAAYVVKPVRRIGTFTMGASLIATGIVAIYSLINPRFDVLTAIKFTPIILIFLGIEILISAVFAKSGKLKYDFLSGFVCFILIAGALSLAVVPTVVNNWGPRRDYAENKLESEIYDACYSRLKGSSDISDMNVHVNLIVPELQKDFSISTLTSADSVTLNVFLLKEYSSLSVFTASCKAMLDTLRTTGVDFDRITFQTEGEKGYELNVSGKYQQDLSAIELEKLAVAYPSGDEVDETEATESIEMGSSTDETTSVVEQAA